MTVTTGSKLREQASTRGYVLSDGAMGTMLQSAGLEPGEAGERWNVERPEAVAAIHRAYAEAGSRIITSNTFGGSSARLAMSGLEARTTEINRAGAEIARAVASDFGALVAGDIGPCGELIEPLGVLSVADARAMFAEQAAGLAEGGADFFLIETMSDLNEVEAALLGARDAAPDLEIAATMSFDTNLRTMMGVTPADAVTRMAELGVVAAGGNCGRGPDDMRIVASEMAAARPDGLLLIAQSNAGMPHLHGDHFEYDIGPEALAAHLRELIDLGIDIVGGCCGSTPAHLAAAYSTLA
ncbi:MAG: homocysteine S-methyltransferase family protein [Gaiellales bacterium]